MVTASGGRKLKQVARKIGFFKKKIVISQHFPCQGFRTLVFSWALPDTTEPMKQHVRTAGMVIRAHLFRVQPEQKLLHHYAT